ncbi:MAG: bifunctional phosphoribosylaminoimidazolecarboxamide formyltransferase/IMP cyclohydrolase [Acidimicrobiia bacterium]
MRTVNLVPVRRALISVADRSALDSFAGRLVRASVEIVSTGGTGRFLDDSGIPFTPLERVTGVPEMLDGRVKTLHPAILAGVLADRGSEQHMGELAAFGWQTFDLVVVNLYRFEEAVASDLLDHDAEEQIDIGGAALLRAAAKNRAWVGAVTSPGQYEEVAAAVEAGGLSRDLRSRLAREAFFQTAAYDAAILRWLERDHELPTRLVVPLRRQQALRYGENPHQPAARYVEERRGSPRGFSLVQGERPSFNNLLDAEAAWQLVAEFDSPAVAIVKHTNPCGAAIAPSVSAAFRAAWACDPTSAYGGVVAANRPLGEEIAGLICDVFVEAAAVPHLTSTAADLLAGKADLRVLVGGPARGEDLDLRQLTSGWLVQARNRALLEGREWRVVSEKQPRESEWRDLEFALTVAAHTKSNAIVIAKDLAAVGVGAGDQSRVGAAERAAHRAGSRAQGAAAASDAFFPFRDGLDVLADAGVATVIGPGGSKRDQEVIAAADERGLSLVFTGRRYFKH